MNIILLFTALLNFTHADDVLAYNSLQNATFKTDLATAFSIKWNKTNYFVTNAHVCLTDSTISVSDFNKQHKIALKVLKNRPDADLCILTAEDPTKAVGIPLELSDGAPGISTHVYSSGYPIEHNGQLTQSDGTITHRGNVNLSFSDANGKAIRTFDLVDTTMPGNYGCSGSAVVDDSGKLIGIVNSIRRVITEAEPMLSFIPVESLINVLTSIEGGK